MNLLQTKEYLLLIDEEAEIKKGDYILEKELIINIFPDYLTDLDECSKIIAYYPLTKEAEELDLPLLPPFEELNDEKIACEKYNLKGGINDYDERYYNSHNVAKAEAFIEGYKAAQSKQYSLEDMLDAFEFGLSKPEFQLTRKLKEDFTKFTQSLSTQQLPKEFIPEYQKDWEETTKMFMESMGDNSEDFKYEETLKTIINSEGKEILVGTYKY